MKYLYFTALLGVVALQGTIGSPVDREAEATNIFGCVDGGICKVSLMSESGKFVAVEKNNKVNTNRGAVASDSIWEVNFIGDSKNNLVSFKGSNGRYMIAYKNGKIECTATRVSRWEEFTVEDTGNGTFAIKSHHKQYVVAEDGAFKSKRDIEVADAEAFLVRQVATNHFGCVVGGSCMVSLKSDNGSDKGKYVAVGATDKDVNANLDAIDASAIWEVAFVDNSTDKVSFKGANGKFMLAHGRNGEIEATATRVALWETFTLEDKGNGKFAIRTHHKRYLVSCHGGLNSIKDADAETFEIVVQTKNLFGCVDGGICKVSLKSKGGSDNGKYLVVGSNDKDVYANQTDVGPEAIWKVNFIEHNMVSFFGSNEMYLKAFNNWIVVADANRVSRWEEFTVEDRGNGTFAIKSYHKKYLMVEDGINDKEDGLLTQCKKCINEKTDLAADDAEVFKVVQADN